MTTVNWSFAAVIDTALLLYNTNVVLQDGQIGIESDSRLFKVGNGTTAWRDLAYATINSQQSVWIGPSADADNLLARSTNDGGITLSKLVFMSATEQADVIANAVTPVLNALDTSAPVKAALYRTTVLLRAVIGALGTAYADVKTNTFTGTTLDARLNTLSQSLSALAGIIQDTVIATDKTWSSTKIDSEVTLRVNTALSNLVGSAPEALNTIYELASALSSNQSLVTSISTDLGGTIRFNITQTLADADKLQARNNIGAVGIIDVGTYTDIANKTLLQHLNEALADTITAAVLPSSFI